MSENPNLKFSTVKTESTAERIVRQIIKFISLGKLESGDKLPSENMLTQQFHASRPSVREAVHTLKILGLVSVRQGDGAYITKMNYKSLANYILVLQNVGQTTFTELSEVRVLFEPVIVKLAIERMDANDIRLMRNNLEVTKERIEEGKYVSKEGIDFHKLIASGCRNPLISFVLSSVLDTLTEQISGLTTDLMASKDAYHHHKKIFQAICNKDVEAASRYIKKDILKTHNNLKCLFSKGQ